MQCEGTRTRVKLPHDPRSTGVVGTRARSRLWPTAAFFRGRSFDLGGLDARYKLARHSIRIRGMSEANVT